MSNDKHINGQDDGGFDESVVTDFPTDKVPLAAVQSALRAAGFIDENYNVLAIGEARNQSEK
ncbi:MAG: hypothetical protein WCT36_01570 [Candidatus Gracilibacteria bacterium]